MTVAAQDLRTISLFREFSLSELELVCGLVTSREYPAHSTIFTQEEPSPGLWFVRQGRVRLYRVAPSGREFTLCIAQRDNLPCVGACPLFDGDHCPVNAEALEDATLYFIDRQRALAMVARPGGVTHLLARVLANHSRKLLQISSGLALQCSSARLVDLLLTLIRERGKHSPHGLELDLGMSHQTLASLLGTSPQMIAQDLLSLERAGVLEAQGKRVVITNLERLEEMT